MDCRLCELLCVYTWLCLQLKSLLCSLFLHLIIYRAVMCCNSLVQLSISLL
jgi:hypothetical protein